jgi:hypothetical protein
VTFQVAARVEVIGVRAVARELELLGLDVGDLKEAFSTVAAQGARLAAEFAPYLTGTLSRDVRGNRAKNKAVVMAGRASVPYAGPINYGWAARNIEGAFFMQKASDAMEPIALVQLEIEIDKKIVERGLA